MNQYGGAQNTPYSGQQQDSGLVNNPRYQGQSGGTVPLGHDGRGPQEESRYGAVPLSTGTGTGNPHYDPVETIRNPAAYGFKKNEPEGFRFPGTTTGAAQYGSQQQAAGMVDPNARPSQAGYGSQTTAGYGQHHNAVVNPDSEFAREQPGYGQPGFGAPSQGQNTSSLWPSPATPPNAHRSELVGQGYGEPRQHEGVMNKMKDAVGMGPNSGQTQGYDNRPGQGGYGQGQGGYEQGQAGYDQPRKEGVVDKMKDAVGMGPNTGRAHDSTPVGGYGQGQGGYGQSQGGYGQGQGGYEQGQTGYDQPRKEGMVDKMKDAVGMGPNTGRAHDSTPGSYTGTQEYNPNLNHPYEERGFGGGLGHPQQYDQSQQLGDGYNTGMATGADAYTQPRREGVVDKVKDAAGVGPNSGYNARTQTGNDAYVHGNHPPGMQDRIQGVNEPTMLGGRHGDHIPEPMLGERRTEPGYDTSKGPISSHLPGHGKHDHNVHGTGLGGTGLGTTNTDYDERRGKRFEDTTDPYDSKLGTGTDSYDATTTGTGIGYDDTDVHGTGTTAPPKKGLITKIKEKMHH